MEEEEEEEEEDKEKEGEERDGRGIVTESDLVFSRRRIRRGWRSSFWASVDKRRRQSRIVIMRQWSGWLSRQTVTIERGFWKQKQKRERERPDPRRTAAPLSIMRSCTRNYAPRFSGIAKNSRRCTETGAAPLCAVLRVLRHRRLARFSFISFRHHPPSSSHRIINVTKPGLVDALCIQAPTLGANGIISRRVYLASIESVFN